MLRCHVCESSLGPPIVVSKGSVSITSICIFYPKKPQVYFCAHCAHVQTEKVEGIGAYYNTQYNVLTESEEEDQIYKIDGWKRFRLEHQAATHGDAWR